MSSATSADKKPGISLQKIGHIEEKVTPWSFFCRLTSLLQIKVSYHFGEKVIRGLTNKTTADFQFPIQLISLLLKLKVKAVLMPQFNGIFNTEPLQVTFTLVLNAIQSRESLMIRSFPQDIN